jgi:hypothetical protein
LLCHLSGSPGTVSTAQERQRILYGIPIWHGALDPSAAGLSFLPILITSNLRILIRKAKYRVIIKLIT